MPVTNRDLINSAMGGSQDPNQDDYQTAMGGGQYSGGVDTPMFQRASFFITPFFGAAV